MPASPNGGCCSGQIDNPVDSTLESPIDKPADGPLDGPPSGLPVADSVKPATEKQVDSAVAESFPASDASSTQRERPGTGETPPDLSHRLPPTATDAEREAVHQAREGR
ncbi:MAG: hypothetical protein HEQ23_13545 [Tepidisphaera sp.]